MNNLTKLINTEKRLMKQNWNQAIFKTKSKDVLDYEDSKRELFQLKNELKKIVRRSLYGQTNF